MKHGYFKYLFLHLIDEKFAVKYVSSPEVSTNFASRLQYTLIKLPMCTNFIIMAMHSQFSLNPFEVIFRILQFRKIFTIDWKSSSTATTTKRKTNFLVLLHGARKFQYILCNFPNTHIH